MFNELKKIANEIKIPRQAAFMEPQVVYGDWIILDGPMGGESIEADLIGRDELDELQEKLDDNDEVSLEGTSLEDFCENKIVYDIDVVKNGYGARLSAPGYMDRTDWAVFKTEKGAEEYLMETYDLDENLEEIEDW